MLFPLFVLVLCFAAVPQAQAQSTIIVDGNIQYRDGEYARARDTYSGVLSADPDNVVALNNRGLAFVRLGNREAALSDFARALQLDPKSGETWNNRANLFCDMGEYEKSFRDRLQAFYNGRFNVAQAQGSLRRGGFFRGLNDGVWGEEESLALEEWTRAGCPGRPADRLR